MFKLLIHQDAEADLDSLWKTAAPAAAKIEVLLQEIQSDQALLDALTDHDFGAHQSEKFHVSKWLGPWNRGINLWRLKVWDLEQTGLPYRVVYAYEYGRQRYHVLGIIHRSFNYDIQHPIAQRILRAYEEI